MGSKRIVIRIKNLSYTYEKFSRPALDTLCLDIYAGEYTAILGANGSGKSTLLNCINGLNTPPPGSVRVYDRDGRELDAGGGDSDEILERIRRVVGTVTQNPEDQIVSTVVEEDAAFGPENLGLPEDEIRRRVDRALKAVDLGELRDRPPQFLSGGEQQRLAIAGVLALENEVIALDEAASMIDPAGRESLLALLDTLAAGGKTVLHITHSLEDAFRCNRCVVLHQGRLVFDGRPGDLLDVPEMNRWGFRLPESAKALRSLAGLFPGFSVSSLESGETAKALRRMMKAAMGDKPRFPSGGPPFFAGTPAEGRITAAGPLPETPPPGEAVIWFDSVYHEYLRGTAFAAAGLSGMSCCIPRNRSVILIGTSGSGKSTALKHINALLLPARGRVRVLGQDTADKKTNLRSLRFRASLAVQRPESALFEAYVADDVAYGPRNAGFRGPDLINRVKAALEETGLPYGEFADRETGSLSGGEKRRAALAGILAMDSEILLLDEPAAALDGRGRERVLALIRKRREAGKTIIATTHSMDLAAAFDLAGVMVQGRLAAFGPPREIFGPRWDSRWGMRLPWTARVARELAEGGCIPPGEIPLNAEELTALIAAAVGGSSRPVSPVLFPACPSPPLPPPPLKNRRRRKTGIEFFKNVTLGLFLNRPSPLRRLGAGKKLCGLLFCAAMVIAGPGPFFPLGILALVLLMGARAGGVGPKHLLRGLIPALPYIGIIMGFQFFFSWPQDQSRVLFALGFVSVTLAELIRAGLLLCRLAALMALLALYSAVTPLRDSLKAINRALAPLSKMGFPSRDITLAIGIALRFVPILTEEAERIVTAQLSRGGGKGRVRTVMAMAVPLLLRALERSETLAKAMSLRLYPPDKKRPRKA